MLVRSLSSRVIVPTRVASSFASASVRHLSVAACSSPVALGKRPVVATRPSSVILSAGAVRHLSWSLGKSPADAAATVAPAVPVAEPETTTSATYSDLLDVPVPSSDIPSSPAEHALSPAQHLTSTAPDHHFHSDPTALLPQAEANSMTPTLEDLITNSGLPLEQVLNSPEAVHAATKVSDLELVGLGHGMLNFGGWVRDILVGLHDITGLPWWATIMALTLSMRLCFMPLVLNNLKHNVRLASVQPQMQALMKRIGEAKASDDKAAMAVTGSNLRQLLKEQDVSPFRPVIVPFLQLPFFIGMFYALETLATLPLPQLKEGGFGWVTDLTIPDPYYILPFTSVALQMLVFRVGADGTGSHSVQSARTQAHTRNALIALSPVMILLVSQFDAAVLLYWTSANLFTLTQAWLLKQAPIKSLLGVPNPPNVPTAPRDAHINPNPSIPETWEAIKGWHSGKLQEFREQQAEAKTVAAVAKQSGAKRAQKASLSPTSRSSSSTPKPSAPAFPEGDAAPVNNSAQAAAPTRVSREEAKRRRIATAREKRARK